MIVLSGLYKTVTGFPLGKKHRYWEPEGQIPRAHLKLMGRGWGWGCGLPRALMQLDGDVTMMYEDLFFYNPVRKICRSIVSIISLFALTK